MYKNTVWECSAAEDVCLPPCPRDKVLTLFNPQTAVLSSPRFSRAGGIS